jgi:Lon protease-like protein
LILSLFTAGRERQRVPIFPLQTVLYPGGLLPLRIFEVRYMDMAKECLKSGKPFGVCLIREGQEVGAPAVPEAIGCLAAILDCDMEELGILKVRVKGGARFRIVSSETSRAGLILGEVEPLDADTCLEDAPGFADCRELLAKMVVGIGRDRFAEPMEFDDPAWVGFRLAEILPLRLDVKQKLLELTDASLRLAILHRFLRQQHLL